MNLKMCLGIAAAMTILWGSGAHAQEILDTPVCVTIRNTAPWTALGTLASNSFTAPNGVSAHHRVNFRLKTGEKTQICSKGPFYPGRKHELTLRTLVPIFSCMTKMDAGEIVIKGAHKPEGGTKTWAECFE
ncbi:MAG TPA: hypothetical protein PKX87_03375 [Alphaproteobacteria bacterium]|nr:hypothetical protein [Alphaproteobacteria bacterium]